MLQLGEQAAVLQGLHVRRLTRSFLANSSSSSSNSSSNSSSSSSSSNSSSSGPQQLDEWQYVASILCNVTRLSAGRDVLKRPELRLLELLLPQLHHPNAVRRRGIAGCLRNLCFEETCHQRLLQGARVLPALLQRLADARSDEYSFEEKVILDPGVWRVTESSAERSADSSAGAGTVVQQLQLLQGREPDAETRSNLVSCTAAQ